MAISSDRGNQVYSIGDFPDVFGELDMDDGENLIGSEFDSDETNSSGPVGTYRTYSARQRIEIAREGKWLKSALSDFDAYHEIEDIDDFYSVKFSH